MILNIFAVAIFYWFCCASGLVAYAKYFDCDPIRAKVKFYLIVVRCLHAVTIFYFYYNKVGEKGGPNCPLFYDGHSRKHTGFARSFRRWYFQRIIEVNLRVNK